MPEPWPSGPDPLPGTVIELTLAERMVVRGPALAASAGRLVKDDAAGDLVERGLRLVRHLARAGLVLPERCALPAALPAPTLH